MHEPTRTEISDAASGPVEVTTPLCSAEVARRLAQAGRRGRLPGYRAEGDRGFCIDCDAVPFEYSLVGEIGGGDRSVVRLRTVRRPLMPWVFAATLIATVWPGVWLTDSLMGVYWTAYSGWSERMPWLTYAWYLPITALPLPWVWRALTRKSAAMARESAGRLVATVRGVLGAEA